MKNNKQKLKKKFKKFNKKSKIPISSINIKLIECDQLSSFCFVETSHCCNSCTFRVCFGNNPIKRQRFKSSENLLQCVILIRISISKIEFVWFELSSDDSVSMEKSRGVIFVELPILPINTASDELLFFGKNFPEYWKQGKKANEQLFCLWETRGKSSPTEQPQQQQSKDQHPIPNSTKRSRNWACRTGRAQTSHL